MTNKVNVKDIASHTGLSITTVSRVLNGKAKQYRIGKKSQQIIEEAAKELNYIPNHYAANLKSGKSNTLGLILSSLSNPFFARMASFINDEVRKKGYTLIIGDSNEDIETERMELLQFISQNIEGLIIVPCGNESEHIEEIHNKGIPLMLMNRNS